MSKTNIPAQHYEMFEFINQFLLSPLLWNTKQSDVFRKTNKLHEEMFLDMVCRIIKPDVFFEIGAYEAATSQTVASKLPNSGCFAFEADPDIYGHFQDNIAGKKIKNFSYNHLAVSDHDGSIAFKKQIKKEDAEVSNLEPSNSIRIKGDNFEYTDVTVPCRSIDSIVNEHKLGGRFVLRIDVEGMCYEVLQGSQSTLENVVAIYAEVEDYIIWQDQKTVFDIYEYLSSYGFVPVSRDVQTPGQYNVLWLRHSDYTQRIFRSRLALYHYHLLRLIFSGPLLDTK